MARRRFQFSDGQSSKFWEIQLKGKSFAVRYGKLGSAGQTLEKQFASPQDAKEAFDKLIREKLKKGYRECTGADPEPSASRATAAKKAPAAGQAPNRQADLVRGDLPGGGKVRRQHPREA